MSRRVGGAGFAADDRDILRGLEISPQEPVRIVHREFLGFAGLVIIRCLITGHMNDFIKGIIFNCFIKDQIQIIGGSVMIVI